MWKLFPRLIEQKINSLLDCAEPTPAKAFQLYKTCQRENLWPHQFDLFSQCLRSFFSLPLHVRSKSDFDNFLDRPMDRHIFELFQLSFRNAIIPETALAATATWTHNMFRVNTKSDSAVISKEVFARSIRALITPGTFDKDENFTFDDFCQSWKATVYRLFGKKYDHELQRLLRELKILEKNLKVAESEQVRTRFIPSIYLTQTEIDWVVGVQKNIFKYGTAPKFPLSRGPQKPRLIDLQRAISLLQENENLTEHRDRIRDLILDQCECLLKECAR